MVAQGGGNLDSERAAHDLGDAERAAMTSAMPRSACATARHAPCSRWQHHQFGRDPAGRPRARRGQGSTVAGGFDRSDPEASAPPASLRTIDKSSYDTTHGRSA